MHKKIYMIIFFLIAGFCLFQFVQKNYLKQMALIDFAEISEDRWTEAKWKDEVLGYTAVEHDFFRDPNQKYIPVGYTDPAAVAVVNYSKRSELEESEWELRRLYGDGDSGRIAVFVKSDTGRELYLYVHGGADVKYLLAADVKEGEGLMYMLGDGRYSYDSALEWTTYEMQSDKNRKTMQYSLTWSENAWIYDTVYLEESAYAMEDYLNAVKAPGGNWELLDDDLYVGVNGYLADIWYTNGIQKAHMILDIWNKQYVMVEVISSDDEGK